MGSTKWITGILGWVAFGPIGGLIGFLLGKAVDNYIDSARQLPGGDGTYTQQRTQRGGYTANEQRNSFFVSLLVLSSAVIRADGKTLQSELDCVRNFLRQNFGEQAAAQGI